MAALSPCHGVFLPAAVYAGNWNEVNVDQPAAFTVLGYKMDTLVTWEDDGRTLVSTITTTAAGVAC